MSTNRPPRRVIEDCTVYEAVNLADTSDRFRIVADSEALAKAQLIDKLGYTVKPRAHGPGFMLVDADTDEIQAWLASTTYEQCLDEVLKAARWRVQDAVDMIGGALGDGFGDVDES